MLGSKALRAVRQFSTTAVRREHAYEGPGHNLPFDVQSKYKFTLYTALFFSSGFGLPFLMVRYVKKRSG
ncbi:cytochrome c oxidase subunit 7C, mitochondrial-like [Sipha flava]|uniref:Cytochrome c oxidase subunit 7C, mitochondrial n=1 Tax=Sipha flava TaxID=143950 RepID=A0A8B8G9A0_9HEMI|nr:cytochrome c oxidase subunit 7C, mitochondrial-like [Sipha flava]